MSMTRPSNRRFPSIAMLIAISAVGPLALNLFLPSMPGIAREFGVDYAVIQWTLTLYLIAIAIAQIVYGQFSDRFGRRPVLIFGLVLFLIGCLICMLSVTVEMLIAGRVVQAVGGSSGLVLGRSIIRDLFARDRAASLLGYVTMAMAIAPMAGPAIGGVIDDLFGWRVGFGLLSVIGAATLAGVFASLKETNFVPTSKLGLNDLLRDLHTLFGSAAFCGYAAVMSFSSAIFFAFLAGAPYITIELMGKTSTEYGLYFMLGSIGYIIGNFLSGRHAERVGSLTMMNLGICAVVVATVSLIGIAAFNALTPLTLFGVMGMVAIGNGMILPSATASAISVFPALTGAASGLSGMLQLGLSAIASVVVGSLQQASEWPMAIVMLACAVLALFGLLLAQATDRR